MEKNSGRRYTLVEILVGIVSVVTVISFVLFVLLPAFKTETKQKESSSENTVYNFVQQPAESREQAAGTEESELGETEMETAEETAESGSEQGSLLAGDYVIADSNQRNLTEEELQYLSDEELWIARNEIYARLGRLFTNETLQSYFNSKPWYHGRIAPESFTDDMLNSYERANTRLIKAYEERRQNGEVTQVHK